MNTLADLYTKLDPGFDHTAADAETLTGGNIILIPDPDGALQPFAIRQADTDIGDTMVKSVEADHLYYELGFGEPKSYVLTNATPATAIADALDGTRWQVGDIDDSLVSITKDMSGELLNPLQRLRQIESEYEARLRFRCEPGALKPAQLARTEETEADWGDGEHDGTEVWNDGLILQDGVPEGTRTSPPLALDNFARADSTLIEWDGGTDSITTLEIYTAITEDGDNPPTSGWEQATNGQPIPGIDPGQNLSGKFLWCRQVLTSEQPFVITPVLRSLTITMDGQERGGVGIYGLFVDLLEIDNDFKGMRFEFGHNLQSVKITADFSQIKTALIGTAVGEEVDKNDNPVPMDFRRVEWSRANGDPADKPCGQNWVGDEQARRLYGIPDGQGGMLHRFGKHEPQGTTPEGVLQGTWTVLQRRNRPQIHAEATVADLSEAIITDIETGEPVKLSHEKIRLGNITYVLARHKGIVADLSVRLMRLIRPLKAPEQTQVELGDPLPLQSKRLQDLEEWQRWVDRRRRQFNRGIGPATVTVASEDTSLVPWYARYIVPAGELLSDHWEIIMDLLPERGGQVILLEGTQRIDAPLVVDRDNVQVSGQGAGTVISVANGADISAAIAVTGNDVTVSDLAIDGNKGQADCQAGVMVEAQGGKLQNVTCRELSGSGIVVESASEIIVLGSTCNDNGESGIHVLSSEDITIEANTCLRNSARGIHLYRTERSSVSSNKCRQEFTGSGDVENQYGGIRLEYSSHNLVQGNTCSRNAASGISVWADTEDYHSSHNIITGNSCEENYGAGILIALGPRSGRNVVSENVVRENNWDGILVFFWSPQNKITGNFVSDNVGHGISLQGVDFNMAQENQVTNNGGWGIDISGEQNFVTNNSLSGNTLGPIADGGSGTVISPGNRF